MGDMLQTTPLVRGLRSAYPDCHISVMVRPMGKPVAERNPDIDELFVYDEDAMFNHLRASDSHRLVAAYNHADAIIQWIRNSNFDVAYNCTHSYASALLLKIAGVPEVIGAHLSDDGAFVLRGPWAAYFFTSVFHRAYNDLNLSDIIGRFAEGVTPSRQLTFEVDGDDKRHVSALLSKWTGAEDRSFVCFQLGASEEDKRWPPERFAELARLLKERFDPAILLLGVESEAVLGERFERAAPGLAVHLFGKTTVGQAAAVLRAASLLVTNDTGTMHLAAAVRCPIVLVSVGHVHFRETGPYGAGHWAVEATGANHSPALRGTADDSGVQPRHVFAAAEAALADGGAELDSATEETWRGVSVYRSEFAPDGCLQWYPLIERPLSGDDLLRLTYRGIWLRESGACRDRETLDAAARLYLRRHEPLEDFDTVHAIASPFESLAGIAHRGIQTTQTLMDSLSGRDLERAESMAMAIKRIDEEVRIHGEVYAICRPLTYLTRFERDNLEGIDALLLAQHTLRIYERLHERASAIREELPRIAEMAARR